MRRPITVALATLFAWTTLINPVSACTGIRLKAKDGTVVCARTMEFALVFPPAVTAIPRGVEIVGDGMGGRPGLKWSSKYAAIGMGAESFREVIAEGLNEKGLGAGIFLHPGYASYPEPKPGEEGRVISPLQMVSYLLTSFATVKEARDGMKGVVVAPVVSKEFGGIPPFHFIVHDPSGDCVVIEFLEGRMVTYDNPIGVITNSPSFDWHLTNLRNYVNLSPNNVPPHDLDGLKIQQLGQGTGLLGLPGDFTPPSRFIRAVALSQAADQADDGEGSVNTAFHILNSFDIIKGTVRERHKGEVIKELTQWTTASDLKGLRFYYRTYEDQRIRFVDLKSLDLISGPIRHMPVGDKKPTFEDESCGLGR